MNTIISFAPLEGITNSTFRRVYENCFPQTIDAYYTPFITTGINKNLGNKEIRELSGEANPKAVLIPQLLAKGQEEFIHTAEQVCGMGYSSINLNLGCPSRTVTSKTKGAALLGELDMLRQLLDGIYSWGEKQKINISIKTRIGVYDEEEWEDILNLYNQYPVEKLIVHPRTLTQLYGGKVSVWAFEYAMKNAQMPLVFNGDIVSDSDLLNLWDELIKFSDHEKLQELKVYNNSFIKQPEFMIGRGFLSFPGTDFHLTYSGRGHDEKNLKKDMIFENIWKFHDAMLLEYTQFLSGEKNVLFKMKELWIYMKRPFDERGISEDKNVQKIFKNLLKCKGLLEYTECVKSLKYRTDCYKQRGCK